MKREDRQEKIGRNERKREQERDKHTAWTLMCLWDTNRKRVWSDAAVFRKFTAYSQQDKHGLSLLWVNRCIEVKNSLSEGIQEHIKQPK